MTYADPAFPPAWALSFYSLAYMVVRLGPKVHYCQGGVEINVKAEVVDSSSGRAIPGLYAAGEVTGGIHGVSRLGSCSIPECLVMGITAARSVAGGAA